MDAAERRGTCFRGPAARITAAPTSLGLGRHRPDARLLGVLPLPPYGSQAVREADQGDDGARPREPLVRRLGVDRLLVPRRCPPSRSRSCRWPSDSRAGDRTKRSIGRGESDSPSLTQRSLSFLMVQRHAAEAAGAPRAGPQRMTHRPSRPAGRATDREIGVVAAVLVAGSEKATAHRRGLSHSTVKHHLDADGPAGRRPRGLRRDRRVGGGGRGAGRRPTEHGEAAPRRPGARSGLTTEQLIYRERAEGWLVVPSLEPSAGVQPL